MQVSSSNSTISTLRKVSAQCVAYIHLGVVAFLILGWLLPEKFLIWHLSAIGMTVLHWRTNNDQCALTQLQWKLEGREITVDDEGQFIKSLFAKFGKTPSRKQLFLLVYGLLAFSFLITALRVFFLKSF